MSIIVRAKDTNLLIYKYLLEHDYNHSAYTFKNESNIDILAQESKLKSIPVNYLYNLLERALIFQTIETHSNLEETQFCDVDTELIKPHTCNIVEKNLKEMKASIEDLNLEVAKTLKAQLEADVKGIHKKVENLGAVPEQIPTSINSTIPKVNVNPSPSPFTSNANKKNASKSKPQFPLKREELILPKNHQLLETFSDGVEEYYLLKTDTKEVEEGYYQVSKYRNKKFRTLFILPLTYLNKFMNKSEDNIKIRLSVNYFIKLETFNN